MPPRIHAPHVCINTSPQCFRTRPQTMLDALPVSQTRSATLRRRAVNAGERLPSLRWEMFTWLKGPGKAFRDPLPNSTNYMSAYDRQGNLLRGKRLRPDERGASEEVVPEEQEAAIQAKEMEDGMDEQERNERFDVRQQARMRKAEADARGGVPREGLNDLRPYPLNRNFRSEPVLSEELREAIYTQVVGQGLDIETASITFGVDTRRIAAVVRMKTIEKRWIEEGKPLAKPYNDAVLAMLPKTPYRPDLPQEKIIPHESINDLPVHPRTRTQIFWPTSESRQFTREDAAKAFDDRLLPADERIAHPVLITAEKEILQNLDREERYRRLRDRDAQQKQQKQLAEQKRMKWEERTQRLVPGKRWDFKFQDISAEKTGRDGRARNAVGARYGMPHEDRKRGMVKIPTSVE